MSCKSVVNIVNMCAKNRRQIELCEQLDSIGRMSSRCMQAVISSLFIINIIIEYDGLETNSYWYR